MKKLLFSLAMVASAICANAQNCNQQAYVKHIYGASVKATAPNYTYLNGTGSSVQVGRDNVAESFNFVNDTMYVIHGTLRVDSLDLLTIEKGTVIFGTDSAVFVVQRGAQISAIGTRADPIVFTSFKCPGFRAPGDWGGLVICGAAKNNIPGGQGQLEGGYGAFHGGSKLFDDSGDLNYVRIEFAGLALATNQEVNGLTLGSVGSGTSLQFIQVSHTADDAFEWFGGNVNSRFLVSFKNLDDDFDCDFGFTGLSQFGMAVRDANYADISGSNGFEIDNDAAGSTNTPLTRPVFSNYTVLGPKANSTTTFNANFKRGAHLRRNSSPQIFNTVIAGWPETQILIDGQPAVTNAVNNLLKVKNSVVAPSSFPTPLSAPTGSWAPYVDILDWYDTPAFEDSIYTNVNDLKISAPYSASPNYRLNLPSKLTLGAKFDAVADPVFSSSFWNKTGTFRGANNATSNWANDWTEYNPQAFVYDKNGVTRQGSVNAATPSVLAASMLVSPNPSNGNTSVGFTLEAAAEVEITVSNMQGVVVKNVVKANYSEGDFTETFNVSDLTTGLYVVNVKSSVGSKSVVLSVQ